MSVGGSIESLSIKGRGFAVAADADASVKLGGYENEVQANGNGTARTIKTRVPWSITGLAISLNHERGDLEFLQGISDSLEEVACAITFADGTTYSGTGTVTGELAASTQSATVEIALSGGGELVKV